MKVVLIAKKKESECQSLMALTLLDLFFTLASRSLSCSLSQRRSCSFDLTLYTRWDLTERVVLCVFSRCTLKSISRRIRCNKVKTALPATRLFFCVSAITVWTVHTVLNLLASSSITTIQLNNRLRSPEGDPVPSVY